MHGKGRYDERLPLTADVGEAITADLVRIDRRLIEHALPGGGLNSLSDRPPAALGSHTPLTSVIGTSRSN